MRNSVRVQNWPSNLNVCQAFFHPSHLPSDSKCEVVELALRVVFMKYVLACLFFAHLNLELQRYPIICSSKFR